MVDCDSNQQVNVTRGRRLVSWDNIINRHPSTSKVGEIKWLPLRRSDFGNGYNNMTKPVNGTRRERSDWLVKSAVPSCEYCPKAHGVFLLGYFIKLRFLANASYWLRLCLRHCALTRGTAQLHSLSRYS